MKRVGTQALTEAATRTAVYEGSTVFRAAERAGARLSSLLTSLFLYLDRALWASIAGRTLAVAWQRGMKWSGGSIFVQKIWLPLAWPLVRLAFAPSGTRLGPETAVGIALALACLFPTEIVFLVLAGALCLILWLRVKEKSGSELWSWPLFGTTVAFAVVFIFLAGATVSSVLPVASVSNLVIWCFYGLAFYLAADAAARGRAESVLWPFLTGATMAGLVGVYQKLSGWVPPSNPWLDERFKEDIVRYVGTFTNPTFFAEMLGLALPLTLALFLRQRDWRDRVVLLGFAGVQSIAMLLTSSRGAWLGLIASFGVLAVLYERRLLILGLVAGVLLLAVAPPVLVDRFLSSFSMEDSSNSYRIFIWRGSLAILREYLFRGVGLGAESFGYVYPEFMIVQTPAPHAHSTYIQVLIELGLFGFLSVAWFFLVWSWDVLGVLLREKGGWSERWLEVGVLAGVLAAIGGHLLQGVIEYTWYNPRVTMIFWAIMGIGSGIVLKKRRSSRKARRVEAALVSSETGGDGR